MKKRNSLTSAIFWLWLFLTSLGLVGCGDSTINPTIATTGRFTASVPIATLAITALPPVRVAVGYTAPDFTAKDVNGQTLQLSSLRGKVVLLNFWSVT